ncbi:hypothetical protein, partial [Acinetobacter pittii]|uniref:hypothetical protein n=1 Tax=Acinetobacter pittii TaxID=48296 RepID=UPI0013D7BDD1
MSGATIGLGPGSSGVATITGTGSSWSIVNNLIVGDHGTAHLTVSAGGAVSNTAGFIGDGSGDAAVTVTGAGSTWT